MLNACKLVEKQPKSNLMLLLANLPANTKGICLALLSSTLFVLVGILVRKLSVTIDAFEILFFRQLVFIVLLIPAIKANIDVLVKPRFIGLHFLRILGAFTALYLGFITISNIPLANATAIGFSSVLFVAILSKIFLFEKVSTSRWFTLLLGFLGVLFIVQPDIYQADYIYLLIGLAGAFGASLTTICIKKIIKVEPKVTLLVYQAFFVGIIAAVPAIYNWVTPSFNELILLIMVGGISSLAQWIGVTAYKFGEANIIANVEYSKILYSLAFGYILFSEIPNIIAVAGVALILLSAAIPYLCKKLKH